MWPSSGCVSRFRDRIGPVLESSAIFLRSMVPVLSFFLCCKSSRCPILSRDSGTRLPVGTVSQVGMVLQVGTGLQVGMVFHSASTELTWAQGLPVEGATFRESWGRHTPLLGTVAGAVLSRIPRLHHGRGCRAQSGLGLEVACRAGGRTTATATVGMLGLWPPAIHLPGSSLSVPRLLLGDRGCREPSPGGPW